MITLLTIDEVAALLHCSPRTVKQLPMPFIRVGRPRMYDRTNVLAYMEQHHADQLALWRKLILEPPTAQEIVEPRRFGTYRERMVYFARAGQRIKIGSAKNVDKRIRTLQTGIPEPIRVLGIVPGGVDREKALHELWSHQRIAREWFRVSRDLLSFIKMECARCGPTS